MPLGLLKEGKVLCLNEQNRAALTLLQTAEGYAARPLGALVPGNGTSAIENNK